MSESSDLPFDGVSAQITGGTPSPLSPEESADALETVELPEAVELVAARAVGPLGAARVRARRPSADLAWIAEELARAGEVAALFRRGDTLLAEPIPDVGPALARLRIAGSVLEGAELARIQRMLVAARLVQADLRRVADTAPLAAGMARPLPDRALERRLEQSVDLAPCRGEPRHGARSTRHGSGSSGSSRRCCAGSTPIPLQRTPA